MNRENPDCLNVRHALSCLHTQISSSYGISAYLIYHLTNDVVVLFYAFPICLKIYLTFPRFLIVRVYAYNINSRSVKLFIVKIFCCAMSIVVIFLTTLYNSDVNENNVLHVFLNVKTALLDI